MRRRTLYPLIFTTAAFILFIPWFAGELFKLNYDDFVSALNKESGVNVEIINYEQGWFSSFASIRVTFNTNEISKFPNNHLPLKSLLNPVSFTINEHITHGPIIFDTFYNTIQFGFANIHHSLHLPQAMTTALGGNFQSDGILQIDTLAEFNGNWKGYVHIPAVSYTSDTNDKLQWLASDGNFHIHIKEHRLKHFIANQKFGSLLIQFNPANASISEIMIQPITYKSDSIHGRKGLWSGFSMLYTSGISIKYPNGDNLVAGNVVINTKYGFTAETIYNSVLSINAKNLTVPSRFNPIYSDVHITFNASNFDLRSLSEFAMNSNNTNTINLTPINSIELESALVSIISPTSLIHTDVSANTAFGPLSIHAKSTWNPKQPLPKTLADVISGSSTKIQIKTAELLTEKIIEFLLNRLKISEIVKEAHSVTSTSTTATTHAHLSEPNAAVFKQKVGQLLADKKITFSESLQIFDLVSRNSPPDKFATYIDSMRLKPDVIAEIKELYQSQMAETTNQPPAQNKTTIHSQEIVADLLTIGYIAWDKEYYVILITSEDGVWKINGRDLAALFNK